jgi:Holliday junction resolvase RusA-like endonuclease
MTEAVLTFEIHGEPVGKGRPIAGRSFGAGKHITMRTPAKTASYEAQVKWFAAQAMAGKPLLEGPLWMHIAAFFQLPKSATKKLRAAIADGTDAGYVTKSPDASNIAKSVEDGMNGIVYHDDAQLSDIRVIRRYAEKPRVVVSIGRLK